MKSNHLQVGLLDTSVIIDLGMLDPEALPTTPKISAVSLAELGLGIHARVHPSERAIRMERIQRVEAAFRPLPFDTDSARRFTLLAGLVVAMGRSPKPRRMDLMIAAVASVHQLPLFTRNPADFAGLDKHVAVVVV